MEKYKIYAHINIANGKIYIGQTCKKNIDLRFGKNGIQYKKCPLFWNAINKYGWENFQHILLVDNITKEQANIVEIELIKKYRTNEPDFGYNISEGGSNGSGKLRSKKVYQYNIDGKLINIWESAQVAGDELNIIPSNISACCLGISSTCNNYVWSYKRLNVDYFENIKLTHCKPIKQYDKDCNYLKTFHSIKEASENTDINCNSISISCQNDGKYLTNNLYRLTYDDRYIDKNTIKGRKKKISINQYNLSGILIKTWGSAYEASKDLSIYHSNITKCCLGRQKTAGGFIWKYADENIYKINDLEKYKKKKNVTSKKSSNSKRIAQYTMDDKFIKIWDSSKDINKFFNKSPKTTNIQACCRGARNNAFGYKWKYCDDEDKIVSCT